MSGFWHAGANAQSFDDEVRISPAKLLGINVILSGVTAGAAQAARGNSFLKGFLQGSIGGVAVYAGKCLLVQRSSVTDWAGRATVAAGSSAVANAAAGRPLLQELVFPLGPVRFFRNNKTRRTRVKLDLGTTVVAAYFVLDRGARFTTGPSLTHGALVFEGEPSRGNLEAAGVLFLSRGAGRQAIAHELVHVGQGDFASTVWEGPLQDWMLGHDPIASKAGEYIDLGILLPVWAGLNALVDRRARPWEKEARSLAAGC
ncbi:MAG: hypothetical protein ACR2GK_02615 [Gemmatimonadaceae bacterium]